MTEPVLIAIVTGVLGLIGTYLEVMRRDVKSAKSDAAEARSQTKNSHTINLRDDLDDKHTETVQMFAKQDEHNEKVLRLIGGLEKSNSEQWAVLNELRRKLPGKKWL